MKRLFSCILSRATISLVGILAFAACGQAANEPLKEGATIDLGGRTATLRTLETLPFVESEYTRRFKFDSFANPKLMELRERGHLDDVVALGKDEFERQVLLMDWTHRQFKKFGRPSTNCHVALQTLTPNFKRYEVRIDSGGWKPSEEQFNWTVHSGSNRLEARTVNQSGVTGPTSTAVMEVKE